MIYLRKIDKTDGVFCKICGKRFYPTGEWVYVINTYTRTKKGNSTTHKAPVCSWTCFRTHEKNHKSKKGNNQWKIN